MCFDDMTIEINECFKSQPVEYIQVLINKNRTSEENK